MDLTPDIPEQKPPPRPFMWGDKWPDEMTDAELEEAVEQAAYLAKRSSAYMAGRYHYAGAHMRSERARRERIIR